MYKGLSSAEASNRLKSYGFNELPAAKPKNVWLIALEVIKEPMFLLLISCGILYMFLGDYREGAILSGTILLIIFITFYQYRKTEKALDALRKLSSPRALVVRDGTEFRIPGREVVPGDLLLINEGDRIAADAEIVEAFHLTIDESLLTGESVAVRKSIHSANGGNRIFSGTLVVQGKGIARVKTTGKKTQFGQIGTSLQLIEPEDTRLQKEMKLLIRNLFIMGAIISIGVVVAFYTSRGNFIQSLLSGLSSAMAILPEEFPVVLTVFLALGAWRLSTKNVLTRNPSAIETLGAATVLCRDKTGTITQNKMEIAALHCPDLFFTSNAFPENKEHIYKLITTAQYASQTNSAEPMEKAIDKVYRDCTTNTPQGAVLKKEYPLSTELMAFTRVIQHADSNTYTVYTKGAPEAIFPLCGMNKEEMTIRLNQVHMMAEKGYRILAAATAIWNTDTFPATPKGYQFSYQGLLGFEDPIRPEVPQAVKECNEAGIKVIMITGDFPVTAKSIARQIGMNPSGELLTGDELKQMTDVELKKCIEKITIFARVIPEQKLRIVQTLKVNNEIVAMTGDGVNDAPALKTAHIGIAMGNKGTDVAREASSLVLLDDNFASIVSAMRTGRKIFDNLQKAMSYIIAIHIPIIGLTLLPAFFPSLPLLLLPLHIVFMELIIDPVCSIAFESEQEEYGIMKRPPRSSKELFFGGCKILFSAAKGILLFAMVITIYLLSINEGHTEGEVRAITFSALIIGNIFLILSSLSKSRNVFSVIAENNKAVTAIILSAVTLLVLITSIPTLQVLFSFQFPGYRHFIPSVAAALILLLLLEIIKYVRNQVKT